MVAGGFSWPSTAFCSMAVYSSVNGMGVALVPSALKVSRNKGLWITRSFRPARSSAVLMGRRELVTWRKPFSQKPRPIRPLSGSMASSFWPKGPSSKASASASVLKVSGRFSTPKGLISDISVDESGIVISSVPPRRAEVMLTSLPRAPLANSLAFILQALGKVAHGLGLRVVVAQANADLEGVFLDLGRDGGGKGGQQRGSKRQGFSEGLELHGVLSPLEWLTPLARPSAYAAFWGKPSWTQGEG